MSDLLPPTDPPPAPPEPAGRRRDLRCQFCECSLTATGDVLKMSDRAKALRDFEDDLQDCKRDLADARKELADTQQAIETWKQENAKLAHELKKASKFW